MRNDIIRVGLEKCKFSSSCPAVEHVEVVLKGYQGGKWGEEIKLGDWD